MIFELWDVDVGTFLFATDDESVMRDYVKKLLDHHGDQGSASLSLFIEEASVMEGETPLITDEKLIAWVKQSKKEIPSEQFKSCGTDTGRMSISNPPVANSPKEEEMEGQKYVRFPKQVNSFLTGNYAETEEAVLPLFRELSYVEEQSFRLHARENYVVGTPINEGFHPIWQDEARKMNSEARNAPE